MVPVSTSVGKCTKTYILEMAISAAKTTAAIPCFRYLTYWTMDTADAKEAEECPDGKEPTQKTAAPLLTKTTPKT